jgi:membrane associated rhomboid family serine protease
MLKDAPMVKYLLVANAAIYLLTLLLPGLFYRYFALHNFGSERYNPVQFLTYQFLHSPGPLHIIFNMMLLFVFGVFVEWFYGSRKFLLVYLLCGVAGGLLHNATLSDEMVLGHLANGDDVILFGASGSVWGMLSTFAMIRPNDRLNIFFLPVGVRSKWLILSFFVVEVLSAMLVSDNVSHYAHIGGAVAGVALYYANKKYQPR